MLECELCKREFKNANLLANHKRFIKNTGQCKSKRTAFKTCPNPQDNKNCTGTFVYSKSGMCKSCSSKTSFNDIRSGKTYEELYGIEKATELKIKSSERKTQWNLDNPGVLAGENNPNYGKQCVNRGKTWEEIHGEEKSKKLKELHHNRLVEGHINGLYKNFKYDPDSNPLHGNLIGQWTIKYGKEVALIKWKEYIEKLKASRVGIILNCSGENNGKVKFILKKLNISYDEYLKSKSDYDRYRMMVLKTTREQPIHILENYDKRAPSGINGAYQLDHIVSIKFGFDNNIPPDAIGHISNLRCIPWLENIQKSSHNTADSWDMFQYFIETEMI